MSKYSIFIQQGINFGVIIGKHITMLMWTLNKLYINFILVKVRLPWNFRFPPLCQKYKSQLFCRLWENGWAFQKRSTAGASSRNGHTVTLFQLGHPYSVGFPFLWLKFNIIKNIFKYWSKQITKQLVIWSIGLQKGPKRHAQFKALSLIISLRCLTWMCVKYGWKYKHTIKITLI